MHKCTSTADWTLCVMKSKSISRKLILTTIYTSKYGNCKSWIYLDSWFLKELWIMFNRSIAKVKTYQIIISITNLRKSVGELRREGSGISSRRLLNGGSFIQELVINQDSIKSIHLKKPRKKWEFLKKVLMITSFKSDSGIASTSISTSTIMKRSAF